MFYVDVKGSGSADFIIAKIRELVIAKGVQVLIFDHISAAINENRGVDERTALDRIVGEIKSLTMGVSFTESDGTNRTIEPTVLLVSHVNDDGKTRGSRALVQYCNTMINLKRLDKEEDSPEFMKGVVELTVTEQRRPIGLARDACYLTYNYDSGRVEDRTDYIQNLEKK